MTAQKNIVYYLDNNEISILEIEDKAAGLLDIAWLIYKGSGLTQSFTFRRAGTVRLRPGYGKLGYYRGSGSDKKLYIEIDRNIVPFRERKADWLRCIPTSCTCTIRASHFL
ncbi:hypothetical protein FMM05_00710 [Flavobacterium zepuense]|uniref:Uncharacterized protein n=1 Tax=Flavobacterium zepuense TaxID=2593302 RepID=A0A552V9P3_9FLAO|nr:hypothetical protein [Flavobacterium zepuense]TRW27193.1 hypothetical protein FMM05_00710 [Flavobacterium zepuense]